MFRPKRHLIKGEFRSVVLVVHVFRIQGSVTFWVDPVIWCMGFFVGFLAADY
jgi:hypothetical protein